MTIKKLPKDYFKKPKSIIAFDPGSKHIGVCVAKNLCYDTGLEGAAIIIQQIETFKYTTKGFNELTQLFFAHKPDLVVVEDFKLYPSRLGKDGKPLNETHFKTYDPLHEVRIIGVILYLAHVHGIETYMPMASQVKSLKWPNKSSGINVFGRRTTHTRDAFNHVKKLYLHTKNKGRTVQF